MYGKRAHLSTFNPARRKSVGGSGKLVFLVVEADKRKPYRLSRLLNCELKSISAAGISHMFVKGIKQNKKSSRANL
jgi:hypothetical protein